MCNEYFLYFAALGNGPVTKWGADNSPLAKAIGNIGPFAAAGFNVSYSDNGLFGVVLSVPKDEAKVVSVHFILFLGHADVFLAKNIAI